MITMRSSICRRCHRLRFVDHGRVCMTCERELRNMERPRRLVAPAAVADNTLPPPPERDTLPELPGSGDDE